MNPKRIRLADPIQRHIAQEYEITPRLTFDPNGDFAAQQKAVREKFLEILQIPEKQTNPVPLVEEIDHSDPRFDEIRFCFESEPGFFVPAHLLLPKQRAGKLPLVICLQGHSPGMFVSLAREAYPSKTPIPVEGDRDFCIQAVARGYAAVAMEQRGFGELNFTGKANACHELSWQAAMMGRTLMGERIRDISALVDAVEAGFDEIDCTRIGAMGNSGGGTSSYFAACADPRIQVTMPSSSFCTFRAAWGSIYHCDCSYIPGILKEMEMPDMALMIAPRPLVIVNGRYDPIQPFADAQKAFETVKQIYALAGAPDNCRFVVGAEGHRFYAADAWPVFDSFWRG